MGLRFRKSVSLCKGVRLNFGKTGVSLSSGIPGFRKTIHSSGRVTTSVGIPGTGIYYVDTKNPSQKKTEKKSEGLFSDLFGERQNRTTTASNNMSDSTNTSCENALYEPVSRTQPTHEVPTTKSNFAPTPMSVEPQKTMSDATHATKQFTEMPEVVSDLVDEVIDESKSEEITYATIKTIFENCDVAVDWVDVISHRTPTSNEVNAETWEYLHKKAVEVFDGNIDTFLEIISTVNPYDDLLDYAENFEFGTDDSSVMEVEFSIIDSNTDKLKKSIFEDYYSAIAIRVARDTFALLPIEKVIVHVAHKSRELLVATFERDKFHELDLVGKDASDIIKQLV